MQEAPKDTQNTEYKKGVTITQTLRPQKLRFSFLYIDDRKSICGKYNAFITNTKPPYRHKTAKHQL